MPLNYVVRSQVIDPGAPAPRILPPVDGNLLVALLADLIEQLLFGLAGSGARGATGAKITSMTPLLSDSSQASNRIRRDPSFSRLACASATIKLAASSLV